MSVGLFGGLFYDRVQKTATKKNTPPKRGSSYSGLSWFCSVSLSSFSFIILSSSNIGRAMINHSKKTIGTISKSIVSSMLLIMSI